MDMHDFERRITLIQSEWRELMNTLGYLITPLPDPEKSVGYRMRAAMRDADHRMHDVRNFAVMIREERRPDGY